jgi:catechol 2,3-dioxygenase-like lactoylglutathione lyase family enzyme
MSIRIKAITFDCTDPYLLAKFWSRVTGFHEDPEDGNYPDDPAGLLLAPDRSASLLFVRVPERKQVKNHVHLDLAPIDPARGSREAELERIMGLGATLVGDHRRPDGGGWVVLADPEGNEFCIERAEPPPSDPA